MTVRKFKPDLRLVKLAAEPGGIRISDALRRADERLAVMRDECVAAIDGQIEALASFAQSQSADGLKAAHRTANEVFALAGTFGLKELSAAAHSLREMLGHGKVAAGSVPWAGVQVHVDALRNLRHPDIRGDQSARIAIVEGLKKVSARVVDAPRAVGL
jgi:hypothetical protein